jgi:hypothetical protein
VRRTTTTLAGLAVASLAVAGLAACGGSGDNPESEYQGPQYQGICADPNTGNRIDDSNCRGADGGGGGGGNGGSDGGMGVWDYLLLSELMSNNQQIPAVGSYVDTRTVHVYHHNDLPSEAHVRREPAPRNGGYATFNPGGKTSYTSTKPRTPIWTQGPVTGANRRTGNRETARPSARNNSGGNSGFKRNDRPAPAKPARPRR